MALEGIAVVWNLFKRHRPIRTPHLRHYRPRLEQLEDRCLLTVPPILYRVETYPKPLDLQHPTVVNIGPSGLPGALLYGTGHIQDPDGGSLTGGPIDGRVAIITGGGRGIGAAVARAYVAEGAKVVINDLGGEGDGTGSDSGPAREIVDLKTAFALTLI